MTYTITVLIYPLILIGIGIWRARTIKSHADFMVAGRSLPAWVLVGSLVCTWVGSGTLFGAAGLAFREGMSALWFSIGAWFGLIGVYFLAPRVRRLAQYTVPDILEPRYNSTARVLGTGAIILAYVTIAAYQFRGGGWILSIVTDGAISPDLGMYITAITIVTFTAVAGMVSIVSVDVVNGVVIGLGVLIALPYLIINGGGFSETYGTLPPQMLTPMGGHNILWVAGVALPTFLLLFGESGMYQKFFSARDSRAARKAVVGMIIGVMVIETTIALIAMAGRSLYPELLTQTSVLGRAASETVILLLAKNALPLALGAALLAAAVAIVLSSGSTMLLVPSTNVSRDIYERFVNPEASDKRKLTIQRISIVAFGGIGLLLLTQFETVISMALYAYSLVGASLTPVLVAAFLWKRVTAQGAVACLTSGLVTIIGLVVLDRVGMDFSITVGASVFDLASSDYVVIPAVLVSVSVLVLVSLITKASPESVWQPFFQNKSGD